MRSNCFRQEKIKKTKQGRRGKKDRKDAKERERRAKRKGERICGKTVRLRIKPGYSKKVKKIGIVTYKTGGVGRQEHS